MSGGGSRSDHPGLANGNTDWLSLVGLDLSWPIKEGLVYSLWVLDQIGDHCVVKWIDVFHLCLQVVCGCSYAINGAVAKLKPCRVSAETMCHDDNDPDWEYACFGFRVIDQDFVSSYLQKNTYKRIIRR